VCKLNVHQKHFNLFILGLLLLFSVVIVVFWLMCKWQDLEHIEPAQENDKLDAFKGKIE
jgi:CHASE3 domain sensor protein